MINVFSSGVATLIFVWRGVVDLKLGIIIGVSMFLGALLGARVVLLLSTVCLRRNIHCGSAWPRSQTALARALGIIPIRADMRAPPLYSPNLASIPSMVIFDLKPKKGVNCFQGVGIRGLNTHSAACRQFFEAI